MKKNYFVKNLLAVAMLLSLTMGMVSCQGFIDAVMGIEDKPVSQPETQQPKATVVTVTDEGAKVEASSAAEVSKALENLVDDINAKGVGEGKEYIVELSSTSTEPTAAENTIVVPKIENSNINLVFTDVVSSTSAPLVVKASESTSTESTTAVNQLTITVPNAQSLDLKIDMPETTVKLEGNVKYNYVESLTANETLIVGSDVVIGELLLKDGTAVVEKGGVIETYVWTAGKSSLTLNGVGVLVNYDENIAPYAGVVPAKYTIVGKDKVRTRVYEIRQEGEENLPYYCKKLKVVKGEDVSDVKLHVRNSAEKLLEKMTIDDGVKVICQGSTPYIKEIEGVGNATFAMSGHSTLNTQPEQTFGSWGSLEYVESIKGLTLEGARGDDKEVKFSKLYNVPSNTESITFKINDIDLGRPNQAKGGIKDCKFAYEISQTGIHVNVPYQTESIPSYEFTFDNCEFPNTNYIHVYVEKTKLKKDQDGNQVYKDVYCWYKEEDDGQSVRTYTEDDFDKVPDEIKSKGQHDQFIEFDNETGKWSYTEGYWVEQREAYEDVIFDNYYVYLVFNNCKYNGSALTSNTRLIGDVESDLPAGVYTRYVIDGKTYQYIWDKEKRQGHFIEVQ